MFRCKIDGCDGPKHKGRGYCSYHYGRYIHGKPIEVPKRRYNPGAKCDVDGCDAVADSKGLCVKHYARLRKHGDAKAHGSNRAYGSGKDWHLAPGGYVVRYEPENPNAGSNGQVYQHRHVMAGLIGRALRPSENVHHINGDRADNRPENLELWTKGQPAGQRVQDRVKWHVHELQRDVSAALALDPSLREDVEALARRLKML